MVMVLAEHRENELRDLTFEMLIKASELAEESDTKVTAVLLADDTSEFVDEIKPWADEILVDEDPKYETFNSDIYQQALAELVEEREPEIIMIGHSSQGMDLAPALSTELDIPLSTSVIDIKWEDDEIVTEREVYGGKVNSEVRFNGEDPYMVTVQAASFEASEAPGLDGSVIEIDPTIDDSQVFKEFLEFVEPEAGAVDITASNLLVSVGRGIEDEDNLDIIEDLADAMGADISGSRPVIDNGWLPDDRQVGQSGKTVTPNLYLAIGISGASQHIIGMKGADTIVAINKDPDAPIFEEADYGIVDDLFDVVPELTSIIEEEYS